VFAKHRAYWKTATSAVLLLALGGPGLGQSDQQKTGAVTLEEAVEFALKNYPAVRASLERVRAAEAGIGLARTSYLPRTDVLWQSNRATDNNIAGLVIPNSVIAPSTGPVTLSPSNRSAWGSAGGLLFSYYPKLYLQSVVRTDSFRSRVRGSENHGGDVCHSRP
jgi:outer membrane protein TolC